MKTKLNSEIESQEKKQKKLRRTALVYSFFLSIFILSLSVSALIILINEKGLTRFIGFCAFMAIAAGLSFILKGYIKFLMKK